jgi:hypothetical protein
VVKVSLATFSKRKTQTVEVRTPLTCTTTITIHKLKYFTKVIVVGRREFSHHGYWWLQCCCCKHFGCGGLWGFASNDQNKNQVPGYTHDMFTPTTNKLNEYQIFKNTKTISLHPDWLQSMPSTFYYNAIPQS